MAWGRRKTMGYHRSKNARNNKVERRDLFGSWSKHLHTWWRKDYVDKKAFKSRKEI